MGKVEQSQKEIFEKFLSDYKGNKMSVLVGAGFSMNVSNKFLSWRTLMKEIAEYIYKDKIELHCDNYIHIYGNDENIDEIKKKYICLPTSHSFLVHTNTHTTFNFMLNFKFHKNSSSL